jgi:uncharacterized protein (DUF2141 family)
MKRVSALLLSLAISAVLGTGCKKKTTEPQKTGINGTITAQAGFNINVNNIRVQVYLDADFSNLVAETAAVGSETQATYEIPLEAGTYYIRAWKDVDNNGTLNEGDYYGYYANDLGDPKAVQVPEGEMVTVNFQVSIFAGGGGGATGAISGVLTGGFNTTGMTIYLYTSLQDWQNWNALYTTSPSNNTFFFGDLDPGTYYVDGWLDTNSNGQLDSGDLYAYTGTDPNNPVPISVQENDTTEVTLTVMQVP